MTRESLIAPGTELNPTGQEWFIGPEIYHEGYGLASIYASREWDYSESDKGIAVVNNNLVRAQAQDLAGRGFFNLGVYLRAPRNKHLTAIISHEPSELLISTSLKDFDLDLGSPKSRRYVDHNEKWQEGESRNVVYWFEENNAQKWREFTLRITG